MCVNDIDQQLLTHTKSLASFPASHQPQRGSSQYCVQGRRVWWLLSHYHVWMEWAITISHANKQTHLDLAQGL